MSDLRPEEKAAREAAVREQLNAEAEHVMNTSKPTPSQSDLDAIRSGEKTLDDKEEPDNPEMPPLAEQQARIAEAGGVRPLYRTRQARADPFPNERHPQDRELAKEVEKPLAATAAPAAPAAKKP